MLSDLAFLFNSLFGADGLHAGYDPLTDPLSLITSFYAFVEAFARQRGYNPAAVFDEIAKDFKRLEELGKPFLYYENIDGGHSAAANQREAAKRAALEFTYLSRKLMDGK